VGWLWFVVGDYKPYLAGKSGFSFGKGLILPEKLVFWVSHFRFFYYRALNLN
jgi:hypothetical protein